MENLFATKTINPRRRQQQQQQVTNNISSSSSSTKCNSAGRRYYNNYAPRNQFYGNRRRYNRHYYDDENYYTMSRFKKEAALSSSSAADVDTGVDFSKLPSIVLANIYSHLDLTDRLTASSVCKSWRAALLNTPHLWHRVNLVVYLLNANRDLRSAQFKCASLAKYAQSVTLNYDPRSMFLYEPLVQQVLSQLAHSSHNLKQLTLVPILNYSYYHHHYHYQHALVSSLNKRCFDSLNGIVLGAKCIQHLALGCLTDLNYQRTSSQRTNYLVDLIGALSKKQLYNLKSLHVSSVCSSPILAFRSNKYDKKQRNSNNSNDIGRQFYLSNLLTQFVNLTQLSIDYDDLSNEFLNSTVCLLSLKKLNLNVNTFDGVTDNTDELRVRDGAWESVTSRNKSFRVCVNFLSLEETSQKYQLVLSPFMPLQTLRMYFCKSLNPDMLHYLSNTYSDSLASLVVVDSISTEYDEWQPANGGGGGNLYYHNALRYDADPDPDPLVLLSWKCKHLSELIIVGYELLEINLTAIAKLRSTGLKSFYVARDCVMNLRYGHYRHNGGFVEDDEGEDTMPDYGGTQSLLDKMRDSLNAPDWHPLEQDELPNSVYDWRVPDEEAYLDALVTDQTYKPNL